MRKVIDDKNTRKEVLCRCFFMCRLPDIETEKGRWPMPEHAPNCPMHIKIRYIRLFDEDGNNFIDTALNQYTFMSSEEFPSGNWKQEDIYLTEDQFEKLEEFMNRNFNKLNHSITHWMPLPDPPSEAQ